MGFNVGSLSVVGVTVSGRSGSCRRENGKGKGKMHMIFVCTAERVHDSPSST
jgi:hypothetical protein